MEPMAREVLPADAEHTPEWHRARAEGIGGSDIASIVGAGYRSPYAVWLDKTHPETRTDNGNLQMSRGHALEPIVANEFEAETGLTVTQAGTWQRADKPHHIANPDRFVSDGGGLEIKCTSSLNMDMYWSDEAPRHSAELQAQWCMHVTGRDHWWIAAWCWEKPLRLYRLDRDPETIAWIASEADSMWKLVESGTPPDVDAHPTTGEALSRQWEQKFGATADNEDWELLHAQYLALSGQKREIEKHIDLMKHQVMSGMGEATEAYASGTPIATWRSDKNGRRRFTWARLGSRTENTHPAVTRVRDLPRMIDSPLPPKLSTGGAPPRKEHTMKKPYETVICHQCNTKVSMKPEKMTKYLKKFKKEHKGHPIVTGHSG